MLYVGLAGAPACCVGMDILKSIFFLLFLYISDLDRHRTRIFLVGNVHCTQMRRVMGNARRVLENEKNRALPRARSARGFLLLSKVCPSSGGWGNSQKRCGNEVLAVQIRIRLALMQLWCTPGHPLRLRARRAAIFGKNFFHSQKFHKKQENIQTALSAGFANP